MVPGKRFESSSDNHTNVFVIIGKHVTDLPGAIQSDVGSREEGAANQVVDKIQFLVPDEIKGGVFVMRKI